MKESAVQKAIVEWCLFQKHYVLRLNSGAMKMTYNGKDRYVKMCPRGTPDLLVILAPHGKHVFVEAKKDQKEVESWMRQVLKFKKTAYIPRSHQRAIGQHKQHEKIRNAGGKVVVVCSIEELQKDLKILRLID